MKFDFKLDTDSTGTRDLTLGWVYGRDEIYQRLLTRLARVKAEWFLNNQVGLPYYDFAGNYSLLGERKQGELILRLIEESLRTEGVRNIIDLEIKGTRSDEVIGKMRATLDDGSELLIHMNSLGQWS